jgi:hypothetical protein
MGCSDSLTSVPPRFVAFAWWYRVCARSSLPGEGSAPSWVLGLITGCPPGIGRGDARASQVPGGPPCMRAPLCDPDLPPASGHHDAADAAFRLVQDVGQGELDLSRLNHAAHMLAVYASQRWLPEHHARLASSWWPAFAGRDFTRRVPSKGFQSRHGLPPFPSLLGARTILPSGPRSAIASLGSSEGHSLSVGPPGCGP